MLQLQRSDVVLPTKHSNVRRQRSHISGMPRYRVAQRTRFRSHHSATVKPNGFRTRRILQQRAESDLYARVLFVTSRSRRKRHIHVVRIVWELHVCPGCPLQ